MRVNVMEEQWLEGIKWDDKGLIPAIAQDYKTGQVLMFAWMNKESLSLTISLQRAVYWSRSRARLWKKGEESGHVQRLHELRIDCDRDVLLLSVEQIGKIACHTGRESCFYSRLIDGQWQVDSPVLKDPSSIYQK